MIWTLDIFREEYFHAQAGFVRTSLTMDVEGRHYLLEELLRLFETLPLLFFSLCGFILRALMGPVMVL
jgi:hypothetical protein